MPNSYSVFYDNAISQIDTALAGPPDRPLEVMYWNSTDRKAFDRHGLPVWKIVLQDVLFDFIKTRDPFQKYLYVEEKELKLESLLDDSNNKGTFYNKKLQAVSFVLNFFASTAKQSTNFANYKSCLVNKNHQFSTICSFTGLV